MSYLDPVRDALAAELPGMHPDLLDLYTLLALTQGEQVTSEHVHDAWGLWMRRTRPNHDALVPYEELAPAVQQLDEVYVEAIKTVVRNRAR